MTRYDRWRVMMALTIGVFGLLGVIWIAALREAGDSGAPIELLASAVSLALMGGLTLSIGRGPRSPLQQRVEDATRAMRRASAELDESMTELSASVVARQRALKATTETPDRQRAELKALEGTKPEVAAVFAEALRQESNDPVPGDEGGTESVDEVLESTLPPEAAAVVEKVAPEDREILSTSTLSTQGTMGLPWARKITSGHVGQMLELQSKGLDYVHEDRPNGLTEFLARRARTSPSGPHPGKVDGQESGRGEEQGHQHRRTHLVALGDDVQDHDQHHHRDEQDR